MLTTAHSGQISRILDAMREFERSLAELYLVCAETWPEDASFWTGLADAETRHAANIRTMGEILARKPDRFEAGRMFHIAALQTAMTGIRDNALRVRRGDIPRQKMMIVARDLEESILESRYMEIVRTTDVEFQTLMKEILDQTREHKKAIQHRIQDHRTPSGN